MKKMTIISLMILLFSLDASDPVQFNGQVSNIHEIPLKNVQITISYFNSVNRPVNITTSKDGTFSYPLHKASDSKNISHVFLEKKGYSTLFLNKKDKELLLKGQKINLTLPKDTSSVNIQNVIKLSGAPLEMMLADILADSSISSPLIRDLFVYEKELQDILHELKNHKYRQVSYVAKWYYRMFYIGQGTLTNRAAKDKNVDKVVSLSIKDILKKYKYNFKNYTLGKKIFNLKKDKCLITYSSNDYEPIVFFTLILFKEKGIWALKTVETSL